MLKTMPLPRLLTTEYRTVTQIRGPLIFVDRIADVAYNEIVEVVGPDGEVRLGQVMEVDQQHCMVRIFIGTSGLDLTSTRVRFTGDVARLGVSLSMLGRVLDGAGKPIDGGPPIIPERSLDINGLPINPTMRTHPSEFIQTGVSAIDGLNTLTRGQKLPIYSGAGLPANELAAQIASQARVANHGEVAHLDLSSLELVTSLAGHDVAFSQDGRTAIYASGNRILRRSPMSVAVAPRTYM